jgi:uncharacterized membrane protein
LVSVVLSMAVLQFWGFPACKTGDFHFAILGIFSLQETNTLGLIDIFKFLPTNCHGEITSLLLLKIWLSQSLEVS